MKQKKCALCGKKFEASRAEKYCSIECRRAALRVQSVECRRRWRDKQRVRMGLPLHNIKKDKRPEKLFVCSKRICEGCIHWRHVPYGTDKICNYGEDTGLSATAAGRGSEGCALKKTKATGSDPGPKY